MEIGTTYSADTVSSRWLKYILLCGVAASILYELMLVFVPMFWDEYNSRTYTVSELSAIGSPTRPIWFPLGVAYTLLMTVFGYGVFVAIAENRALRFVGVVLMIYGILGIYWPPMHLRGEPTSLTDTLHIVWTAATVLLMTAAIGAGAAAFDKRFRYYSIITLVLLWTGGLLTSLEAPGVPKNLPTPSIGIWERVNIGIFLLWIIVLSFVLIKKNSPPRASASTQNVSR